MSLQKVSGASAHVDVEARLKRTLSCAMTEPSIGQRWSPLSEAEHLWSSSSS